MGTDTLNIVFVSSMENYRWGGSEELWSKAAATLVDRGVNVAANVKHWPELSSAVVDLMKDGVDVGFRHNRRSLWEKGWRSLMRRNSSPQKDDLRKFVTSRNPDLVVLSSGKALPPLEYVELCVEEKWPFAIIEQANHIEWWPQDEQANRYRSSLAHAQRCYFVSEANLRLAEMQLGCKLENAEIVRNPFNVPYDVSPQWPHNTKTLNLACVGRLSPSSKGQDILFEVLAHPSWKRRNWFLTLFGEGPSREGLERLARRLGLTSRITFAGHVESVPDIWASNHVLVMPSRYEGLPLAMVEAMLCGRPVIATDVAGHSEIIEDGTTGFLADAPTVKSFGSTLEKVWRRRSELPQMGERAARHIRTLVPMDPAAVFSDRILAVAQGEGR